MLLLLRQFSNVGYNYIHLSKYKLKQDCTMFGKFSKLVSTFQTYGKNILFFVCFCKELYILYWAFQVKLLVKLTPNRDN